MPQAPKAETKEEAAVPGEETQLSRDAAHSTYSEAPADKDAPEYPPPGKQVEQHLGKPTEASD